jgi:hypothetical protein
VIPVRESSGPVVWRSLAFISEGYFLRIGGGVVSFLVYRVVSKVYNGVTSA